MVDKSDINSQSTTFEGDFENNISTIISALGIANDVGKQIISGLKTYATQDKTKIINNINLYLPKLLEADRDLNNLFTEGALLPYKSLIQDEWTKMITQLAELQGLIILKKVHKNDCDGVIKQLLAAITAKLSVVNEIVKAELNNQTGGSDDTMYKTKYLKYKTKYLNLMKK